MYCKDSEERFWIRSRARFHSIAHAILAGFGHLIGKSATAAAEGSSGDIKALRVLGVTHFVGQAILCGALVPQHIETREVRRAARKMESRRMSATNSIFAFASINVFVSLVVAMEVAWVIALGRAHLLSKLVLLLLETDFGCRMSKLSEDSLHFFLNVLTRLEEILDDDDGVADDDGVNDDNGGSSSGDDNDDYDGDDEDGNDDGEEAG